MGEMGQKWSVDAVHATGVIVRRTDQTKNEIKGPIDPAIETMLQVWLDGQTKRKSWWEK